MEALAQKCEWFASELNEKTAALRDFEDIAAGLEVKVLHLEEEVERYKKEAANAVWEGKMSAEQQGAEEEVKAEEVSLLIRY